MFQKLIFLKLIKRQKTRVLLCCLSFVLALMVMSFTLNVINTTISKRQFLSFQEEKRVLVVEKNPDIKRNKWEVGHGEAFFTQIHLDYFRQLPSVEETLPIYFDKVLNKYKFSLQYGQLFSKPVHSNVYLIHPDYFNFFKIPIEKDTQYSGSNLMVNSKLYDLLSEEGIAIGDHLKIAEEEFVITGIVKDQNKGLNLRFSGNSLATVYVFADTEKQKAEKILLKVGKGQDLNLLAREFYQDFANTFGELKGLSIEPYLVDVYDLIEEYEEGAKVFFIFSLLLLLTTELGVFGVFYLSNFRKAREFAIRMINGNRLSDIFLDIILEFGFISLTGSLIGLGSAKGFIWIVNEFLKPPMPIESYLFIDLILLISVNLISLLIALYPAYKATVYEPVDVLRET